MTISQMIHQNPQKLIDDEVLFSFKDVDGRVKLIDGWAAGGPWLEFEFVSGQHADRKIWCEEDYDYKNLEETRSVTYVTHTSDDGFLFNKDPNVAKLDTQTEVVGGGFYPDWNGRTFVIEDDPILDMYSQMKEKK